MDVTIDVTGLTRTYRLRSGWIRRRVSHIEAVRSIDFTVHRGETFGLLGPNGAGKTTTIKMLNTLLLPTGGTARVLGYDVARDPAEVRRRIGYVAGGDKGLYDRISAFDNLRYFAELYGVEHRAQQRRIHELLDRVGLSGRESERVEGYSRGMRQRLHIARGLLNQPDVLFLDEPSLGLDPVAARGLRELIAQMSGQGMTILLTTHYMAEADELCDRLAIIDRGVIQAQGRPEDLKSSMTDDTVIDVTAEGVTPAHLDRLKAITAVRDATASPTDGPDCLVTIRWGLSPAESVALTVEALSGVRIGRLVTREPTLEDFYVATVSDRTPAMRASG